MEHILKIIDKEIHLKWIENGNCWQTNVLIGNINIDIEINYSYHKEKEVDWKHFEHFFEFINKKGHLEELIKSTTNLVSELGKTFYRYCLDEVSDYKMVFSNSIFYNGKTDGSFITNGYSYSLIFYYYAKRDGGIYGDDYGIYLADIENNMIVGVRRIQC